MLNVAVKPICIKATKVKGKVFPLTENMIDQLENGYFVVLANGQEAFLPKGFFESLFQIYDLEEVRKKYKK